jgi:hypothetical protein
LPVVKKHNGGLMQDGDKNLFFSLYEKIWGKIKNNSSSLPKNLPF